MSTTVGSDHDPSGAERTADPIEPVVPSESSAVTLSSAPVRRRVVFVAGSGRSGTSTIAGILKEFGVHVPQPEVTADDTNPKGFAEPQWLVDFNNDLLNKAKVQVSDARPAAWFEAGRVEVNEEARAAAVAWLEEQFLESGEVVLKDPRLIWVLGLWQSAALRLGAKASVVTMLRPPTEVVGSKRAYYGHRGEIDSIAGWVNLMLHTERATRGSNRAFVQYHDLLDDWTVPLAGLGEAFDLHAIKSASAAKINAVHQFVDPNLRRVAVGWEDMDIPVPLQEMADETWALLCKLAEQEDPAVHAALDDLRQRYSDYYAVAEAITHSSAVAAAKSGDSVRQRRDQLIEKRDELRARVAKLKERRIALRSEVKALRRENRQQRRRIEELELKVHGSVYDRITSKVPDGVRRRVPTSLKKSARRAVGRRGNGSEND